MSSAEWPPFCGASEGYGRSHLLLPQLRASSQTGFGALRTMRREDLTPELVGHANHHFSGHGGVTSRRSCFPCTLGAPHRRAGCPGVSNSDLLAGGASRAPGLGCGRRRIRVRAHAALSEGRTQSEALSSPSGVVYEDCCHIPPHSSFKVDLVRIPTANSGALFQVTRPWRRENSRE